MLSEHVFRDLMAGVCGPVTIVTAASGTQPYGATVSAFASLSLSPPMITVALDRRSSLLTEILHTDRFGVNVLGHGDDEIAMSFARRGTDRFSGIDWRFDHDLPRLTDAPGWLVCRLVRAVDGGDHMLLLGEVIAAETRTAAPLVYGHRTFGTHSAYVEQQAR
ncbi:flavin reductase family protein [Nocardia sp. NBC_01327]|uniref:flavin reductase family protein n=1 Tax=Nocardia sp. NBC_01327 TaxID=2903593 RepID=UPI002E1674FD|nr:flavin reductase family protein [Nocardia sp. NBC_01327]